MTIQSFIVLTIITKACLHFLSTFLLKDWNGFHFNRGSGLFGRPPSATAEWLWWWTDPDKRIRPILPSRCGADSHGADWKQPPPVTATSKDCRSPESDPTDTATVRVSGNRWRPAPARGKRSSTCQKQTESVTCFKPTRKWSRWFSQGLKCISGHYGSMLLLRQCIHSSGSSCCRSFSNRMDRATMPWPWDEMRCSRYQYFKYMERSV